MHLYRLNRALKYLRVSGCCLVLDASMSKITMLLSCCIVACHPHQVVACTRAVSRAMLSETRSAPRKLCLSVLFNRERKDCVFGTCQT
jgi:hypothetical protein